MLRPRGALPVLLAVTMVTLAASVALAADWPQFQADAAHTGVASGPAPPYAEAWSTPVAPGGPEDRFGLSAPIVVGSSIVAVGPEEVVVLDAATGREDRSIDRELGPPVPAAYADTADGALLVFTEGWGEGPALTGGSATPSAGTTSPSTASTPTPSGIDGDDAFEGPSRLVAVSWPDGERAWEVELPQVSRTGVTVAGDLALVGTNDGTVTAVDVGSGTVAWTFDAGAPLDQGLAVAEEIVLVPVRATSEVAAALVGLHAVDGTEAWRSRPSPVAVIAGSPATDGERAFVALSDGSIHALSVADGTERWRARVNRAAPWATPVAPAVAGGRVSVADLGGQLYTFDAATGERVWDHARNVSVYHPAPVVAGGVVLMGTVEGQVVAFDADDGDAVWHRDLGEGPVRWLASSGEAIVVVRGGPDAGVLALTNDPGGTLVDERSPTVAQPLRILGNWAAASLLIGVVLVTLGRFLWSRMGPPDLEAPEEPIDDHEGRVEGP